ncbi:MAG: hypothetical protein KIS78_18660 [Labilithrix sp.]|nr:hypothetical protein [Labilithrix sp.]MCW5834429.1 hypothetical protein [Labilithrix sp.]
MNRLFGQALAVAAFGVLATALTPACAENDQSIFIRSVLAPSINRQGGVCTYTADITQPMLSEGVLDVGIADSYVASLLVGNQLIPRGNALSVRAESNRARLNGAVVRVSDPSGATLSEFTALGSGFVDPALNNLPSYSAFFVTAIDPASVQRIADQVPVGQTRLLVANIKVFGQTLGGVDLETGEFQYPIRVCNGCLVDFSTGDDKATDALDCSLPLGDSNQRPCSLGQDEPTPCQLCVGRPVCDGG